MSSGRPDAEQRAAEEQRALVARVHEIERSILDRRPEHDLEPSLDRIAAVMDVLGEPQRSFPVVHVTGTNGKTSTTRIIERLLREMGLRTGRFTSPHLQDVRERIAFDGEPISAERFVETYDEIAPILAMVDQRAREAGKPTLTYFEVLVAIAYTAFADAPVDVAVVEVGMGGAWDATNVADGQVAVVTPIAIDHERFLGSTVAEIAREKAGIIKPGAVAVIGEQPEEAMAELLARVAEVGASVAREDVEVGLLTREVALGGQMVGIRGIGGDYDQLFLPLHGPHQAHNLVTALAAVEAFIGGGEDRLDVDTVRAGVAGVESPGRLEVVRRSPTVLVDAAHNPAGAAAVADAVEEAFGFTRLVGLVAVLEDKDARGILEILEPVLDEVVVTRTSSARSTDPDELGELAESVFGDDRVHVVDDLPTALETAVTLAEERGPMGGGVLATGSVTMAADVRRLLGVR